MLGKTVACSAIGSHETGSGTPHSGCGVVIDSPKHFSYNFYDLRLEQFWTELFGRRFTGSTCVPPSTWSDCALMKAKYPRPLIADHAKVRVLV